MCVCKRVCVVPVRALHLFALCVVWSVVLLSAYEGVSVCVCLCVGVVYLCVLGWSGRGGGGSEGGSNGLCATAVKRVCTECVYTYVGMYIYIYMCVCVGKAKSYLSCS